MQLAPFPSGPAHGIGRNQPSPARRKPALRQLARRLLCCTLALPLGAAGEELADLSLEQLMAVPVVGASKYEQTQDRVAAPVTVITRDEIRSFGWRTLDEALATLPGVHTTYDRQYSYVGVRGFGLAGEYMTRVLVTIDGVRVNEPAQVLDTDFRDTWRFAVGVNYTMNDAWKLKLGIAYDQRRSRILNIVWFPCRITTAPGSVLARNGR